MDMSNAESIEAIDDTEVTPPVIMPNRPPLDDEMDITPMIDMTFLLLIFFILTSKMTAEPTYALPSAKNGDLVSVKSCVVLTMRVGGGETAIVAREDRTVFSEDLEQQAAEIAEYVEQGLSTQKSEVLVRAEGGIRNGEIQRIKQIISDLLKRAKSSTSASWMKNNLARYSQTCIK